MVINWERKTAGGVESAWIAVIPKIMTSFMVVL